MPAISSITAFTCCFVERKAKRGFAASDRANSVTWFFKSFSSTTRLMKPMSLASCAPNGRQVKTSSLVSAGPISRTSRGIPPHAKGMPKSTSGITKVAPTVAIRKSHAPTKTTPPPTQWPCTAAIVNCGTFVSASVARRPKSALVRGDSPTVALVRLPRSNPAEKVRPAPAIVTTRISSHECNHWLNRMISCNNSVERAFSFFGRLKVT